MKTVKQYLQDIPDPVIRDQALANIEPGSEHYESEKLSQAISEAFFWSVTPQGFDYWNEYYTRLKNENR